MSSTYWLDLFTGQTWEEFLSNGAKVSGFRESRQKMAEKVQPGDVFICYLTGISSTHLHKSLTLYLKVEGCTSVAFHSKGAAVALCTATKSSIAFLT